MADSTCSIEGCSRVLYSLRCCKTHWAQLPHGTPGKRSRGTLEAKFWANIATAGPDDCWLWLAGHAKGYGVICETQGKTRLAHRVSFFLAHGYYPPVVRHSCDNPPCVNPAHLLPGTQKENGQDAASRGRSARGTRNHSAKLTEDDVRIIRRRHSAGESTRALGREFGVDGSVIFRLVARKTWKHIL